MPKKTILYLITLSELGGAQRYCFDLADNLKNEFNVMVAFGEQGKDNTLSEKLEKNQIKHCAIPRLKRSISPIDDLLALGEIIKLIKRIKPDIIHLNSSKISILGSLAAFISRFLIADYQSSVIYTAHGWVFNEPLPIWKKLFYKYAEKFTARFKDKIICVSEFDRQTALVEKIAGEKKLVTIHNGLAPINFLPRAEARARLNLSDNKFIIGSLGNLYQTKGFEYLIKAIKKLTNEGLEITTVIIGEGPERKALTALVEKCDLRDKVIFAGRIPEASALLSAFDVYVCSSVKEGLSYTIIEAMLKGLPIIATKVGGNPELIEDKKTGILVKSGDVENLTEKIKELIGNPDLRQKLGAQAQVKARAEFSLEKMIGPTRKTYLISAELLEV